MLDFVGEIFERIIFWQVPIPKIIWILTRWDCILETMDILGVYLKDIILSYPKECLLLYETEGGLKHIESQKVCSEIFVGTTSLEYHIWCGIQITPTLWLSIGGICRWHWDSHSSERLWGNNQCISTTIKSIRQLVESACLCIVENNTETHLVITHTIGKLMSSHSRVSATLNNDQCQAHV